MDLKDYKPVKKFDIKSWLMRGNAPLYAFILVVFLAAVIFMFTTIHSMFISEENNDAENMSEESQTQQETSYIADNQSYMIAVNKLKNYLVIYKIDDKGEFTNIFKVFRCSVADDVKTGECTITEKFVWKLLETNVYGHYTMQLGTSGYIHSVPYAQPDTNRLISSAYNRLGQSAQIGSVYLAAADVKWIYENCGLNTVVKIYEDATENLASGLAELETVADSATYDPTDNEAASLFADNIVSTKIYYMTGINDCTLTVNQSFDIWEGVYAVDVNRNDITSYITVTGNLDITTPGDYTLIYHLSDNFGTNLNYYRFIKVVEQQNTTETGSTAANNGSSSAAGRNAQ
jgi:hypothetical protein